jgi:seryl-tRNA synthetase
MPPPPTSAAAPAATPPPRTRTYARTHARAHAQVEQFCIVAPEHSQAMQQRMCAVSCEFYQALGLPYHVVSIASGGLNNAAASKWDLEVGDARFL